MDIRNKKDFCISLKMMDASGVVIPYTEIDWKVEYWTTRDAVMVASCTNGVLSPNVRVSGDNLNIRINGFDWKAKGAIRRDIQISFPDENYPDGMADTGSVPEVTSMIIV